jgi:site-specific DNA-methyltransferase (adenine-specific)
MITKKQKQVLDFIKEYTNKKGYAPSLEEIKKKLKIASVSTAHFHVKKLQQLGYLNKEENKPRGINIYQKEQMVSIPLLGTIAAGEPIEAIENREMIAVSKSKLPQNADVYALRVSGQSMIDENINDGDIVLVKKQETADSGQKVVALIDNSHATLKTLRRKQGTLILEPANKNYSPIVIQKNQELTIQGIVIDVIKSETRISENIIPQIITEAKYFHIPKDKIVCGDTLNLIKNLPDKSVDLVIADPPYNLSKGSHINFQASGLNGFGGKWSKVMENWDNLPLVDYFKFTVDWLSEAKRILKDTGSILVFGTYHNIGIINTVFQALNIEIINEIVWYKRNSFPNLAGRRFTASHETILWGHVGENKRNYYFNYKLSKEYSDSSDLLKQKGKQMRTVWDIPNNKNREEIKFGKHPTQKPLKVCERIISLTSKEGDLVLSPFSGAGTECVAAKRLNRHYIGFEIDPNYVKIAGERLSNVNLRNKLI